MKIKGVLIGSLALAFIIPILPTASAQTDEEMARIKQRIEETKAKHFSRRGGVKGNTMYIYNDQRGKRIKVKADKASKTSIFKTKINEKVLRRNKNLKVQHYIENVEVKQRGVFRKKAKKETKVYSREINRLDPRVKKIIIIDKNVKIDIKNK
jgi:lipopolysaccharide export LptBFGC system permease protein LptF